MAALAAVDKLMVTVLSKSGRLGRTLPPAELASHLNAVAVSATTRQGFAELLERLAAVLAVGLLPVEVTLPYNASELVQLFRQRGSVESEEYRDAGIYIKGKLPPELLSRYAPYAS